MFGFLKRRKVRIPSFSECPNCGGTKWYEGPSGGMSTNIMCAGCEHWYNYHMDIIPMDDLHMIGRNRRPDGR